MRAGHLAACLAMAVSAAPATAGTRTASFQVAAAIVTGCAVATDASGRWGTIDLGTIAGAGAKVASGALLSARLAGLQLSCTPGTTVSVTADAGDHASGGQRQLAGGGSAVIPYVLYANGSATAWTTQAVALSFPAGVSAQALPVRASAAISSPVPAGTYTDTVRITLSF